MEMETDEMVGQKREKKQPVTKRVALGTLTNRQTTLVSGKQKATRKPCGILPNQPASTTVQFKNTDRSPAELPPVVYDTKENDGYFPSLHRTAVPKADVACTSFEQSVGNYQSNFTTLLAQHSSNSQQFIDVDAHSDLLDSPILLDTSLEASSDDGVTTASAAAQQDRYERLMCASEYRQEIYHHLRQAELRHRPKPGYMKKQPDITSSMRSIMVDWLVEVAEEYKLHRETLCLSVDYVDRFLSQMSVLRGKLQLVGATSVFIASKYEEIYPPEVGEFVYITDDTYTKQQILRMESLMLKVLKFDVAVPTSSCFCERFLAETHADEKTSSLAMFLLELTLVDGDVFLNYLPSVIAASCIYLANYTLGLDAWTTNLEESSLYHTTDLEECVRDLHTTFVGAPDHPQQAVREKYRQPKFHEASLIRPPSSLPSTAAEIVENVW